MEDFAIVDLFISRNESAIDMTKEKYGKSLRKISYNIINNISDVEECESDTYLSAWNTIPPKTPKDYLFAFLAKIVRNLSLNKYRSNHTQKRNSLVVELTTEMQDCIPNPNDEMCKLEDSELISHINTFLESLGKEEMCVFVRRYWFSDSVKEIAKRYSMSESKVKSMTFRTRNKLRDYFIKEGIEL